MLNIDNESINKERVKRVLKIRLNDIFNINISDYEILYKHSDINKIERVRLFTYDFNINYEINFIKNYIIINKINRDYDELISYKTYKNYNNGFLTDLKSLFNDNDRFLINK